MKIFRQKHVSAFFEDLAIPPRRDLYGKNRCVCNQVLALGRFNQFFDFSGAVFLHTLDVFFRRHAKIVSDGHYSGHGFAHGRNIPLVDDIDNNQFGLQALSQFSGMLYGLERIF